MLKSSVKWVNKKFDLKLTIFEGYVPMPVMRVEHKGVKMAISRSVLSRTEVAQAYGDEEILQIMLQHHRTKAEQEMIKFLSDNNAMYYQQYTDKHGNIVQEMQINYLQKPVN